MKFASVYEKELSVLEKRMYQIQRLKEDEVSVFSNDKVDEGWKKFTFESDYCGSHSGEGDERVEYLFAPSVVVPHFDDFSHGHRNQAESNSKFEVFLKSIKNNQYIVLP